MFLGRFSWLHLLILFAHTLLAKANLAPSGFNVTIKTPGKDGAATEIAHKSVHVKYDLPDQGDQWNIVGFEPQIQLHQQAIDQLTVHICNRRLYQPIWYDEEVVCGDDQSMLIYQWTPATPLSPFYLCADCAFEFDKSQTIILTVAYKQTKHTHKEQSGVLLHISTTPPRYRMGTMLIGHPKRGTHFSCRSSTSLRLFYAVKKLHFERDYFPYQLHSIRVRQFGRKMAQPIFDAEKLSRHNETNFEFLSADIFLLFGDYLFLQCDNPKEKNCYFLLYYSHKSTIKGDVDQCHQNHFPQLFKLIPPRVIVNTDQMVTSAKSSSSEGSSAFFIISILLLVVWISIIIGCIIMRRIRGLVNFRTEPSSPFSSQKNRLGAARRLPATDCNQRAADTDHIMQQMDMEQGGGFH